MITFKHKGTSIVSPLKVWTDKNGLLVADGHPGACILFSAAGHKVDLDRLKKIPNASDFFPEIAPEVEQPEEYPESTQEEPQQPRRGPGRPRKPYAAA